MRAQSRPGKRARINLLCRMHACRWTLFVREKKTSIVKAQRVLRFVVLFFYYYADDDFLLFFFFSFLFFVEEEEEKSKAKAKGEIVGRRRILLLFSLDAKSLRIDLTDLSLSLSFGTKRGGKKKKKNAMTREDDLYRALGIERTASQEEIRKAYKTTGTL